MTKKLIAAGLCLAMILGMTAALAGEEVIFTTEHFTMTLPEGWVIDLDDLEEEGNAKDLGYFGDPDDGGLVVAAELVYYEDLKNVALWSSDAEELEAYVEAVLEDYADDNPEWIGNVMAGSIPFVLIRGTDENGEYLYADTMTNGYAVVFIAYRPDMNGDQMYPLREQDIELFQNILKTFKPAT